MLAGKPQPHTIQYILPEANPNQLKVLKKLILDEVINLHYKNPIFHSAEALNDVAVMQRKQKERLDRVFGELTKKESV